MLGNREKGREEGKNQGVAARFEIFSSLAEFQGSCEVQGGEDRAKGDQQKSREYRGVDNEASVSKASCRKLEKGSSRRRVALPSPNLSRRFSENLGHARRNMTTLYVLRL